MKKKRLRNNQTWKIKEQHVFFHLFCRKDSELFWWWWLNFLVVASMTWKYLQCLLNLGHRENLQRVLYTVFHHVYSCSIFSSAGRRVNCSDDDDWISFGCVCGLLLGRNFERWMIGKKKEESKQSSRVPWIMEVYQSRNKMKIDDSDFKWIHHMREFRYWQYGHWSWLFIKMILFFLLLDLSESSFIKQSAQ